MKVVALLFVVTTVCAAPQFETERKYDASQDVTAQQLSYDSDTASLPAVSTRQRGGRDSKWEEEGAYIPVALVYDTKVPDQEIRSAMKTRYTGVPLKMVRTGRSHVPMFDITQNNHIPAAASHDQVSESPTMDMYNDNFGGEHDSQGKMILQDEANGLFLSYNPEVYNRALGIETRNVAHVLPGHVFQRGVPYGLNNVVPPNSESRVVRKIHHYQTAVVPAYSLSSGGESPKLGLRSLPLTTAPSHGVWSSYTTVVEYNGEPEPSMKIHNRRKRDAPTRTTKRENKGVNQQRAKPKGSNYQEFFVEDHSRVGPGTSGGAGPKIFKLKVRRGGVAIAGPGGIATAGSGGTAIVGPGGTAYTTQDGTAVVGPGGRIIEIPSNFKPTAVEGRTDDPSRIYIPPNGKTIATGPFVYYGGLLNTPMTTSVTRQ